MVFRFCPSHAQKHECFVPLSADIHFQPRVASLCAEIFEKVRINPGNFVDGRKVWGDEAPGDEALVGLSSAISEIVSEDAEASTSSASRPNKAAFVALFLV